MYVLKQKGKGFTLLEVIVVLVMIGIITAVAVSRMLSTDEVNISAQTETIKTHLRYAQAKAMNTNSVWGINFISSSAYSLYRNGNTTDVVALPGESSSTVSLSAISIAGTPFIVSFDSWGQPFADQGATGSSTAKNITVSYGSSRTKNIIITQTTGFIE